MATPFDDVLKDMHDEEIDNELLSLVGHYADAEKYDFWASIRFA